MEKISQSPGDEISPNGKVARRGHLAYVTAALPFTDGETFIVPEIAEIERRGHWVTVIPVRPLRSIVHEDARRLNETTIAEPVLSLSIVASALAEAMRAPLAALRSALLLATSRNFRLLLKNFIVFPKGLWLARVVRRDGVDHIHAHWAATSATVALVASRVSGIPWSFTAHRWDITENNLLDKKIETAKFIRAIDAQGQREMETLTSAGRDKMRVIHMGVALPVSGSASEKIASQRPLQVLLGARLVTVKGHAYALEAVAHLQAAGVDVVLHCAGDGPLRARLEKQAKTLGVFDRVRFLGLVDHQKLLLALQDHRWDAALLTSIVTKKSKEGIPVFLIEAMAAGIPVIATNTGGIPELIGNGAGVLVPQRDAEAIAEALTKVGTDYDFRCQLIGAGLQRVRERFGIEAIVSELLDEIYKENRRGES